MIASLGLFRRDEDGTSAIEFAFVAPVLLLLLAIFGIGLGTVILWANVLLLWGYTLSCHSCRHVMGGRLKNFSKAPIRYWLWTQISKINSRHGRFALITLVSLAVADAYVALVAHGAFSDLRIFN